MKRTFCEVQTCERNVPAAQQKPRAQLMSQRLNVVEPDNRNQASVTNKGDERATI